MYTCLFIPPLTSLRAFHDAGTLLYCTDVKLLGFHQHHPLLLSDALVVISERFSMDAMQHLYFLT